MAIAEYKDAGCGSSNSQPKTNGFYFYLEIDIHWQAFLRKLQREITVITKSIGQLKKIAAATLFLNFTVASCVLVEMPLNKAVMVGSGPVEFKCKSDQGYRLEWWTHQSPSKQVLFNGYSTSKEAESFCSVENGEPGKFYLKLTATHEAAQTYVCSEPGTKNESSADLIIIERVAQCEINDDNSPVIMTCDIEFRGNWAPELEWRYNGTLITEEVNTTIISNKSVSTTLTVPVSANDRNYTCTTRFGIGGKPPWTTGDNIPNYVSNSVLTVKANQGIADEHEVPVSANGISVGVVIGIIVALAIIASVIIVFVQRIRKKAAEPRRQEMLMSHSLPSVTFTKLKSSMISLI